MDMAEGSGGWPGWGREEAMVIRVWKKRACWRGELAMGLGPGHP